MKLKLNSTLYMSIVFGKQVFLKSNYIQSYVFFLLYDTIFRLCEGGELLDRILSRYHGYFFDLFRICSMLFIQAIPQQRNFMK